jgi:hypothetical protein
MSGISLPQTKGSLQPVYLFVCGMRDWMFPTTQMDWTSLVTKMKNTRDNTNIKKITIVEQGILSSTHNKKIAQNKHYIKHMGLWVATTPQRTQ